MVSLIVYRVWQCPKCEYKWSDDRTPEQAQVFHVHDGKEVRMQYVGEKLA